MLGGGGGGGGGWVIIGMMETGSSKQKCNSSFRNFEGEHKYSCLLFWTAFSIIKWIGAVTPQMMCLVCMNLFTFFVAL